MTIKANVTQGAVKQKRKIVVQHKVAEDPTLSVSISAPKTVHVAGQHASVDTYNIGAQGGRIPFWRRKARVSKTGITGVIYAMAEAAATAYHVGGKTPAEVEQANEMRVAYNDARTQIRSLVGNWYQRLRGGRKTTQALGESVIPVDELPSEDLEGRL